MGPFSLTIAIDAPRERIFDLLCDLSARPGWIDHFAHEYRLERLPPRGRGAAARFRVNGPAGVRYMETVIAEADRPHRIAEHGRGGRLDRIPIRIVWELREGPTTAVTLTFWTEPSNPVDRLKELGRARWWRRRWRKALRRLRDLIETGAETPRTRAAGGDRLPAAAA
ncbi:MAG TPA: SRPBCC family protein [Solirubrobacterales bacterium]|nr:SRPBCC family protein [Solirubrobacterales bacterium]